VALMDRGSVLVAQAERTLDEIGKLQAELDAGSLTVVGSMGQPICNKLLGELRAHRVLLMRLLGVFSSEGAGVLAEDELDQIRREWESHGS
jgi:hypothetical protein